MDLSVNSIKYLRKTNTDITQNLSANGGIPKSIDEVSMLLMSNPDKI